MEAAEASNFKPCPGNCGEFVEREGPEYEWPRRCKECLHREALCSPDGQNLQLVEQTGFGPKGAFRRYDGLSLARVLEPKDAEPFPNFITRVEGDPGRPFGVHRFNRRLVELLRNYDLAVDPWLYIVGPVGVGKTAAVAAMVQDLIKQHLLMVAFCHETDFYDRLSLEERRARQPAGVLRLCKEAPLLVLDGVGRKATKIPWMVEALEEVLVSRYHAGRPIIFTSNVDVGTYIQAFDESVGSKLMGALEGSQIQLEGYDWRTRERL